MNTDNRAAFIRKLLAGFLLVGLVLCVVVWYFTVDRLPAVITLYTGEEGGLYHTFAQDLKRVYEEETGCTLRVVSSAGSDVNRRALLSGEADLAVLQSGAVDLESLPLLCALYPEVIHVIVRRSQGIESLGDLRGRSIALGKEGSGMRLSALHLLDQYGVTDAILERTNRYFRQLETDTTLDAAIVTTGVFNPDLRALLATQHFDLLPIPDAAAVSMRDVHLSPYLLPRGAYGIREQIPSQDLPVLATTAVVAGRPDLPKSAIQPLLASIYEGGLRYQFPSLYRKDEVVERSPGTLTKEAELYFRPGDRIGQMANILESVAAFKELLFAFAAGLYLLWGRFRQFETRERERQLQREKDQLDALLAETMRIEEEQMNITDPGRLKPMLDEVTRIKLEALKRLTDEGLRGDRVFLIFLTQCGNLISKIQAKMDRHTNWVEESVTSAVDPNGADD